jgi:pimeloyl-ACP methyl ester carboxylesterase
MPFCSRDDAEIYYEEYGSGFPVLLFAPGGMGSNIDKWRATPEEPIRPCHDWTEVLAEKFHVVAMDQRNANRSAGAIASDHGWHTYAEDQLAVADHLGFDQFHALGACIGGSFCLKLAEMAPDRLVSEVLQNPIGLNPEHPEYFPEGFDDWAEALMAVRDDLDPNAVAAFGRNMFEEEFVFSVSKDFIRQVTTPSLLLHGKDQGRDVGHPGCTSDELETMIPGLKTLRDWERPDHGDAQRDTVISFLEKNTP